MARTTTIPQRPILAVDIDGVICPYGWDESLPSPPGRVIVVDGLPHCLSHAAGLTLRSLVPFFELIWASGWEDRANRHLPPLLEMPPFPYLSFAGTARFGTADWKLPVLEAFGSGRPLAWIDDSLDHKCYAWAEHRPEPTLLVQPISGIGITVEHRDELIHWALDHRT